MKNIFVSVELGLFIMAVGFFSCSKSTQPVTPPIDTTVVIQPAIDPPLASSIGFFLDDWQPKTFTPPVYADTAIPSAAVATVTVNPSDVITKVPRSLFGNNANLWMTQITTELPLMTHLTNLQPHIIRFPGGSISDVYFWNALNHINPADAPDTLVKSDGSKTPAGFWYGKNTENWTISLDSYYNMLQQTGNQGLITINYGYARYGKGNNPVAAAAHLAADWVRYDNGRTKYWEIGNENFGDWEAGYRIDPSTNKDGQTEFLTGNLYGQHFKVYADSMKKAAQEIGRTIYIGAVMVEVASPSWATNTYKTWNTGMLSKSANTPDFYVVHNYYTPYNTNSPAADILPTAVVETKKMMDYVQQTLQTVGATSKPIALDEWNIFAVGSGQMSSHVNGMHAVLLLGELIKNKFGLGARWDLANGWDNGNDHAMFNIGDEPGGPPKWNPRPAFFYMYFFQKFLGDRFVGSSLQNNSNIETYASSFSTGQLGVTLVNKSTSPLAVQLAFKNFRVGNRFYWYSLAGGDGAAEFSRKVLVNGKGPDYVSGGPANYSSLAAYSASATNGVRVTVPARGVVNMIIESK